MTNYDDLLDGLYIDRRTGQFLVVHEVTYLGGDIIDKPYHYVTGSFCQYPEDAHTQIGRHVYDAKTFREMNLDNATIKDVVLSDDPAQLVRKEEVTAQLDAVQAVLDALTPLVLNQPVQIDPITEEPIPQEPDPVAAAISAVADQIQNAKKELKL